MSREDPPRVIKLDLLPCGHEGRRHLLTACSASSFEMFQEACSAWLKGDADKYCVFEVTDRTIDRDSPNPQEDLERVQLQYYGIRRRFDLLHLAMFCIHKGALGPEEMYCPGEMYSGVAETIDILYRQYCKIFDVERINCATGYPTGGPPGGMGIEYTERPFQGKLLPIESKEHWLWMKYDPYVLTYGQVSRGRQVYVKFVKVQPRYQCYPVESDANAAFCAHIASDYARTRGTFTHDHDWWRQVVRRILGLVQGHIPRMRSYDTEPAPEPDIKPLTKAQKKRQRQKAKRNQNAAV